ncbi:hypothetical protein [Paractinoplanes rishiriensis]|uniref:Uncharacterized protein n=1 Tax=Paractinoplanes rishiriensis TaxID=1050105 RepID=A0A919JWG6_9ACTN|nr:hypothetical protein [Actinoplanes rishiriensis]GIE94534.1 hypothetical protein Ari01nite_19990 [Actinoplanes rishiriensis]
MYGWLIGALAVAWGVLVAVLDRPGILTGRRADRLCTALLIASGAATLAGALGRLW